MKAAIIGATGYTGLELVRILARHPHVTITALTSERFAGQRYSDVFPGMQDMAHMTLEKLQPDVIARKADIVFTAVPHKEAMDIIPSFYRKKTRIIDLSADFRIASASTYEQWYQKHTASDLLGKAVYGLPEIHRQKIKRARLVANPGCYPTCALIPLAPLVRANIIATSQIIIDAKSGVSGAGRSPKTASLFCEVSESLKAYSVQQHRHQPEIDEQLTSLAGTKISITFVPHLVPMNRGMLSTVYLKLKRAMNREDIGSLYRDAFKDEPFVRLLPEGLMPQTGWVRSTNFCDVAFSISGRRLVLVSTIDNLVKGASGQAVQNMNIMFGLPETLALESAPLYP